MRGHAAAVGGRTLRVARTFENMREMGRASIGLVKTGCSGRPFYQIVVYPDRRFGRRHEGQALEQLGSFDPLPNSRNEKLVAFNFERVRYWMGRNAHVSLVVLQLLGLAGFLPIHPLTYTEAKRYRKLRPALAEVIKQTFPPDDPQSPEKEGLEAKEEDRLEEAVAQQ